MSDRACMQQYQEQTRACFPIRPLPAIASLKWALSVNYGSKKYSLLRVYPSFSWNSGTKINKLHWTIFILLIIYFNQDISTQLLLITSLMNVLTMGVEGLDSHTTPWHQRSSVSFLSPDGSNFIRLFTNSFNVIW